MQEYGFSLTRVLPYKYRIVDSVLIRENTGRWKPVFSHILRSVSYTKNVVIYDNLNIKYIKSNSFHFKEPLLTKIDISLISETKIYDLLPNRQFADNRYKLFRRDNNRNGGRVILYVKENISCKLVNSFNCSEENRIIALRFSISNTKWLRLDLYKLSLRNNPAGIYLLKVNNRNTRTRCEICSKLTIKTPERRLESFRCLYC